MSLRLLLLMLAALALPASAGAQTLGMNFARPAQQSPGGVLVEIVRDGRPFWMGRFENDTVEQVATIYVQQPERRICFGTWWGRPTGSLQQDKLAVTLGRRSDRNPLLYRFRLEWDAVASISPEVRNWDVCSEHLQRVERATVEAEPELPPGRRVRIVAQRGLEIFLTRDPATPLPEHVLPPETAPVAFGAEFEVRIERDGALVWEGVLHQEDYRQDVRQSDNAYRAQLIPCPTGRGRRCGVSAGDRWELRLRLGYPTDVVDFDFEAIRSSPLYLLQRDGWQQMRADETGLSVSRRIPMPSGTGTEVRVGDMLIRVRRR